MSDKIKVYNGNLKPLGSTSKAFQVKKTKELMREYTLSFSVLNNDAIFEHLSENSVFKFAGQFFDVSGIDGDSGETNITQITAEHISYRLADYTLPNGYSFAGTAQEIAEDILAEAKTVDGIPVNTVFSIGNVAETEMLNFFMRGATNVTARDALIAMSELGVEADFDNFTINLPERIGADNGVKFEYGKNLNGVHRTWQRGNGWSYDVKIVDLQKTQDNEDKTFSLGDTVTVNDTLGKLTLVKRIISYTECDDPRENTITVGVFIRDNASLAIETDRIANEANNTANNSVQQGEKYSNISITHKDGFKATNKAGTQRVRMNADDCFVVEAWNDSEWVVVNSLENFGILVDRITNQEAKGSYYATIGKNELGYPGLFLYKYENGKWISHLELWPSAEGDSVVESKNGTLHLMAPAGNNIKFERKGTGCYGKNGEVDTGTRKLIFADGVLESTEASDSGVEVWKSLSGNAVIESKSGEKMVFMVPAGMSVDFQRKGEGSYVKSGTLKLPNSNVQLTFTNGLLTNVSEV